MRVSAKVIFSSIWQITSADARINRRGDISFDVYDNSASKYIEENEFLYN